jgi:Rrf2 family transcriptional regulator, iron-sulfur cluster assembly transcription factor
MNFNKTTEYSLRILSFMALDEKRLYSADYLFENIDIPFRYLRKLMTLLSKGDLIESVQGKGGGYRFSKNLDNISLLDIVQSVGDDIPVERCFFGFENCALRTPCAMHNKWIAIRENIRIVLKTTTLADFKTGGL